ncbi:Homeodomain-like protein, partial [Conidiobolus coronatus NRRL 28638]
KTRKRTTRAQFQVLEESFLHDPKPTVQIRRLLAQKLDMSPRTVQIWFQNRRAKQK